LCALVDRERGIPIVAKIADSDPKPGRVHSIRAEQNRLLRPASGPADAAQLEKPYRFGHHRHQEFGAATAFIVSSANRAEGSSAFRTAVHAARPTASQS